MPCNGFRKRKKNARHGGEGLSYRRRWRGQGGPDSANGEVRGAPGGTRLFGPIRDATVREPRKPQIVPPILPPPTATPHQPPKNGPNGPLLSDSRGPLGHGDYPNHTGANGFRRPRGP